MTLAAIVGMYNVQKKDVENVTKKDFVELLDKVSEAATIVYLPSEMWINTLFQCYKEIRNDDVFADSKRQQIGGMIEFFCHLLEERELLWDMVGLLGNVVEALRQMRQMEKMAGDIAQKETSTDEIPIQTTARG